MARGSQGLCSSASHTLLHLLAGNKNFLLILAKSSSAFCGRIMDCSPVLQLAAMGRTLLILSPLDPHGEFAPVQEAFTTTV